MVVFEEAVGRGLRGSDMTPSSMCSVLKVRVLLDTLDDQVKLTAVVYPGNAADGS